MTKPAGKSKKPTGRPKRADLDQVKARFVAFIASGETTRQAAKLANASWGGVCDWLAEDATFAASYARAREDAGHLWADRAVDVLESLGDEATKEQVAAARAKADIYKWRAVVQGGRWYREKLAVENEGNVTLNVVVRHE